jgi:hypothetical protein
VQSDIPALLLAGELDPRAPPGWARRALPHLGHGVLIEVPGAGHCTLGEDCVADLVTAFLDDPTRPPDSSCLAGRHAVAPLGGVHSTSGPLTLLRAVRRGALAAPLWIGASLLVLASAMLVWPARGLWRWRRRAGASETPPVPVRSRRLKTAAHVSLTLAALSAWLCILGLVHGTLRLLGGKYALAILLGLPDDLGAVFVLPKLVLIATLGALVTAVPAWRQATWTRFERWHFVLALGAAVSAVAFLARYRLF